MKKYIVILFISILYGCTKDEFNSNEWGIEPLLEVSPLAIILTPSHPCDTVKVQTNYLSYKVNAPSWVEIEQIEGYPALVVSAKEMQIKKYKREAYVNVSVKRGKYHLTKVFVVIQFKEDINL